MTRKSKRELERKIDELAPTEQEPPKKPPAEWMRCVPRELWGDKVEALRYWSKKADEAEA